MVLCFPDKVDLSPYFSFGNGIFDVAHVETYLQKYYKADERVREAEVELATAEEGGDVACVRLKQLFRDRAITFRRNQRARLRTDGVPAPGAASARWVLFNEEVRVSEDGATLSFLFSQNAWMASC